MQLLPPEYAAYIRFFPDYFVSLSRLFLSPVQFLRSLSLGDEIEFKRSLGFVALSALLGGVISLPFGQGQVVSSPLLFIGCLGLTVIGTAVFALGIHSALRITRGRSTFLRTFIYCNYLSSVALLIMLMFILLGLSVVMESNIELYKNTLEHHTLSGERLGALSARDKFAVLSSVGSDCIGMLIAFVWFSAGWGAFRLANGFSRARSIVAFLVALLFSVPILAATVVMALGLAEYVTRST